ncbi:DUF6056 family protein [Staphylococcus canis]|uniref:Glucosyltransferase n=1 Tax=Staphylococcus canis TaxID=2724942 RepID=A0ABS0TB08_9STAP|nr:DUF6056 family protein [Staphylococcus canis]MBI5975938.1 hypothetical protein [Staphylococcus canis]
MIQYIKHYHLVWYSIVFYIIMAMLMPLVHDDLEWANAYGIEMLTTFYADLNGRYLGNTLEVIAVRVSLFRYITYALFSILLIKVIVQLVEDITETTQYRTFFYISTWMWLLIIPVAIYSQTYGWFAGFYNYVPVTICTLFLLMYSIRILKGIKLTKLEQGIMCLIALIGQWFMENHTLFHVLLLGVLIIVQWFRRRHIARYIYIAFGLAIVGAILMFSSPNYRTILAGESSYQKVSDEEQGMFAKTIGTLVTQFPQQVVFNSILLITVMSILLMVYVYQSQLKMTMKGFLMSSLSVTPIYGYLIRIPFGFERLRMEPIVAILDTTVTLFLFSIMIYTLYRVMNSKRMKYATIILVCAIPFLIAPLLMVQPIGPRNFFPAYSIGVIINTVLLQRLDIRPMKTFLGIVVIAQIYLILVFSVITVAQHDRISKVQRALEANPDMTHYSMARLPFESRMQHSSPYDKKKKYF